TVPVRRVLAETDVREEDETGRARTDRPQRPLDDAVVVPRARALLVFLLGDPEEDHGADAERGELSPFGRGRLDRMPRQAGQVVVRERLGPDEERHDEVVEAEPGLADETAQRVRAPEPAKPRDRKRAHPCTA